MFPGHWLPVWPVSNPYSYNAGTLGITVGSNKSLIGEGSAGAIKGKGLRIVSGAENIIIQYVIPFLIHKTPI